MSGFVDDMNLYKLISKPHSEGRIAMGMFGIISFCMVMDIPGRDWRNEGDVYECEAICSLACLRQDSHDWYLFTWNCPPGVARRRWK